MTGRSLGALKVALGGLGLCVAHGASTLLFDKNLG